MSITERDIRALIEQFADAWVRADFDAIIAPFADDGRFVVPSRSWQGHRAIREAAQGFFASERDARIRINRIIWNPEARQGAVEWVWSAVDAMGRRYEDEDAIIFTLDEAGKVTYWREYFNFASRTYTHGHLS